MTVAKTGALLKRLEQLTIVYSLFKMGAVAGQFTAEVLPLFKTRTHVMWQDSSATLRIPVPVSKAKKRITLCNGYRQYVKLPTNLPKRCKLNFEEVNNHSETSPTNIKRDPGYILTFFNRLISFRRKERALVWNSERWCYLRANGEEFYDNKISRPRHNSPR